MSGGSSSTAAWFTRLEPPRRAEDILQRPDDPRLAEIIQRWDGRADALTPGRAVLVGFPQDEGVRRNHGREGAALAPHQIRHWLHRLTPWDPQSGVDLAEHPPLDAGNVHIAGSLEGTQQALAEVIAGTLQAGAVPVVLGGGHETAYGHYLAYVEAQRRVGVINVDAHLDVRPCTAGHGHSGSPFRQALEHPTRPLEGPHYVCLGAQPHSVSRQHSRYARERGCVIRWRAELVPSLEEQFVRERDRLAAAGCSVYVTFDADAVATADVPGVSAPDATGLPGGEVVACARRAGRSPEVSSFDLVEVNPRLDRDHQSARWAALVVWNFLVGVAARPETATAADAAH
jgi:formiminoglutamase